MATIKKKSLKRRDDPTEFTKYHRLQLMWGPMPMGLGYGNNPDTATLKRMRLDWRRCQLELTNEHINTWGDRDRKGPFTRPWAFWEFDVVDRRAGESQFDYLQRKNLLTEKEKRYFAECGRRWPEGATERELQDLWEKGDITKPATVTKFRRKRKAERKEK
jgi:hypothetical protein